MITPQEAIAQLDKMQSQIIHGKRTFGDIADCIRSSEQRWQRALTLLEMAHLDIVLHLQSAFGVSANVIPPDTTESELRKFLTEHGVKV